MLPKYFWVYGLPLECDRLTRGYTFRENCLSPSSARGETSCPLSLWWDLVQLEPAQALCMLPPLQWVYLCRWPAVSGRCCFLVVLHPLWFLHSFCPLFRDDPWELGGRCKKIFFFVLFLFLFFEAEPHLAEAGFEPLTFLPPPLKCWDYRHVSPTSSLKFCLLSLLIASSQGAWSIHSCCNSHSDRPHEAHSVGSGCHWFPLHPVLQSLLLAQADLNETNSEFNEATLILPDQLEVRTEVQEPRPAGSPDHKTCWTNYCRWMFQEAEEQNPVYVILSLRGLCVQNILQWENSNEKGESHWVCPRPPGELSRTLRSPKKNRF